MPHDGEKEVRYLGKDDPYCFLSHDEERAFVQGTLPRIIDPDAVPQMVLPLGGYASHEEEEQVADHLGLRVSLDWHYLKYEEMKGPTYTMTFVGGGKSTIMADMGRAAGPRWGGGHRHFFEAIFYVRGGKGVEVHDGMTYEWEGEGVLCIPTYTIHDHYARIAEPDFGAGGFAVLSRSFEYIATSEFEQFEMNPRWIETMGENGNPPEWLATYNPNYEAFMYGMRGQTRWTEPEPMGIYDRTRKQLVDDNRQRLTAPRFVRFDEAPWEYTRQGKVKYIVHPYQENSCLKSLDVNVQEIPAGGFGGKHRHVYEEVQYILEGSGYTIMNGKRYDWQKGRVVCVPVFTEHQHFANPGETVRIVGVNSRWHWYVGCGGIEQLEDCSGWE
jgi:gentisate 1,2-dioxygenase